MPTRRVLVQLDNLELGGTQINAVQISAAVAAHGYESLLIGPADTLPSGPSLIDVAAQYGVPLQAYDRPHALLPAARAVEGYAREWRADVIHAFGTSERSAYWGAGLLGRRAIVRTIYEMSFDPRTHPSVPVVIGTGYLRDELAGRPGGVTLISPPVDTVRDAPSTAAPAAFRQRWGLPADAIVLVIVSRLSLDMKSRAVQDAIGAVGRLADPRLRLVVVGGGDAEERVRAWAAEVDGRLGWDAVVLTGPLSDPRPAYDAADVVLGMGSSAARGMAFGKPVIAMGEHGWSAIFREPEAAEIFRNSFWSPRSVPDAVGLLAGQIAELADDSAERARLGDTAREFAVENFDLAAMGSRLARVYDDALRRRSTRSWVGDLRTEGRILTAKVGRTTSRLTGGRYDGGRSAARLAWKRHLPDQEP
ncbi:glycosyltransferase family 4 protein [Cellulomonas sp.]|uniref:glycosyltransferase family 4 protein n=1 Tax=Cellulomonas sp. TaxID=40001 RepID=UPI003BA8D60F